MPGGEEKLWDSIAGLAPEDVCRRTDTVFDKVSGLYTLKSFGSDFLVSPRQKSILGNSPDAELLQKKLGYFFRLSVIGYLGIAKDIIPAGRLVNPINMKSGQLFFRGSHLLPLTRVADKYGNDREGFRQAGVKLDGRVCEYGDISLQLFPFPRVPVVLILWMADDEFPARADLLFDSACELQLPIDVIWSIAMMSVIAVL